jgi:hypothetical protein
VFAAEVQFSSPEQRAIQILPDGKPGHYLLTFYERKQPLPELTKIHFRRSQLQALKMGHRQFAWLPSGQLDLIPGGAFIEISIAAEKLPPFAAGPLLGRIPLADLEVGLNTADGILQMQG